MIAVSCGTMRMFGLSPLSRSIAALQLRPADIVGAVEHLALQVAEIDGVEVDQAERADAGRRQIQRGGRAQPARADAEDLRVLELALPLDADLRHDEVPAVAADLVVVQFEVGRGRTSRDRRHDADRVFLTDRRLFLAEIPDVFVVDVDVDEAPELAVGVEQVVLELGVDRDEVLEHFADVRAAHLNGGLLVRERTKGGGDEHCGCHADCPRHETKRPGTTERSGPGKRYRQNNLQVVDGSAKNPAAQRQATTALSAFP